MAIPQIAPPPLPNSLPDLTVRVPTAIDVDALYALGSAADRTAIGTTMLTRHEVKQSIGSATARDDVLQLIIEQDGTAIFWPWIEQVHPDHLSGDIQVHPDVPSQRKDALVAWALGWFEQIAHAGFAGETPDRMQLGHWCYEQDQLRRRQLEVAGYQQSRVFVRMTRQLAAGDTFPAAAEGVSVRKARVDLHDPPGSEAALVHSLITASFADHFNYAATPFDLWFARRSDDAGFDPALWFVAEFEGRPVGAMVMNRELEDEQDAGYVHYLGVIRDARGRGVAKALLHHAFAVNRDDGRRATKLFVDTESATGATHLYESAGMVREQVILDWQKWLDRGAAER